MADERMFGRYLLPQALDLSAVLLSEYAHIQSAGMPVVCLKLQITVIFRIHPSLLLSNQHGGRTRQSYNLQLRVIFQSLNTNA
jgi:hypothetical protein